MTERPAEWWERTAVPSVTTANTPTAVSFFSIKSPPMLLPVVAPGFSASSEIRIGDGTLTAQSREQVARITAKAWEG